MKKSKLIEKLKEMPDDIEVELLIYDHNTVVHFAGVDKVSVYGRDPTMKTIRITGSKRYKVY